MAFSLYYSSIRLPRDYYWSTRNKIDFYSLSKRKQTWTTMKKKMNENEWKLCINAKWLKGISLYVISLPISWNLDPMRCMCAFPISFKSFMLVITWYKVFFLERNYTQNQSILNFDRISLFNVTIHHQSFMIDTMLRFRI